MAHSRVRQPAVSGLFYPSDPVALRAMAREYLLSAIESCLGESTFAVPKAIIAPHAGYVYSGSTAARAFASIASLANKIKRVVLLGPSHRVAFSGLATSSAFAMATPLGEVEIDREIVDQLEENNSTVVHCFDEAHRDEHSLEVELPFLQELLLGDFKVVPLVVGSAAEKEIAEVIKQVWGDEETLLVVSSDLSHFLDYDTACVVDKDTADSIVGLHPGKIGSVQACGYAPIRGLLLFAASHGLQARTINLCNSGDTAGGKDRVVGYGAFSFA